VDGRWAVDEAGGGGGGLLRGGGTVGGGGGEGRREKKDERHRGGGRPRRRRPTGQLTCQSIEACPLHFSHCRYPVDLVLLCTRLKRSVSRLQICSRC
jgi:hypothetical protein